MPDRPTALVTGGTAGIGLAFARELACRGHDLVLVARDGERLARTAEALRAQGADVETITADLTRRADMDRVATRAGSRERPVDVLVNNAGFGVNHFFVDGDLADEVGQIDVYCTALVVVCHAAAPAMKGRGHGAIINVSSVSAFTPQVTYSATKTWVNMFTEVLAGELHGSGVTVTAVCPGLTRTERHERAGEDMSRTPDWMWLRPETVARVSLAAARRGRVIVVPGAGYRVLAWLMHVMPRGLRWWLFWGRPGTRREGRRR